MPVDLRPGAGVYPDWADSTGKPYSIGSFGIEVGRGEARFFLTAAHVVGALSEVAESDVVRVCVVLGPGGASSQDQIVGVVAASHPDDPDIEEVALDAALVAHDVTVALHSEVDEVPTSRLPRDAEATAEDDNPVLVHKRGFATGHTSGLLEPYETSMEIKGRGSDGTEIIRTYVRGFMVHGDDAPFAKPGDSGAIVTDSDGCIVGMVVAVVTDTPNDVKPDDAAFVVPIVDLLSGLGVELTGPGRQCTIV